MNIEVWIDVLGYESQYAISNFGNVMSKERPVWYPLNGGFIMTKPAKILKFGTTPAGYFRCNLCKDGIRKEFLIHRLVGIAFVPNPFNLPQINHINGIKKDNRPENLEWTDQKRNVNHAYEIGLNKKVFGEETSNAKITNKIAIEIFNSKETSKALSEKFDLCVQSINSIKRGAAWSKITGA